MKKYLILSLVTVILSISIAKVSYSSSVSDLVNQKEEISSKTSELKEDLDSLTNEKETFLEQVEALDNEVDIVQQELDSLNKQLQLTQEKLEQTEEELAVATETKEIQYESLKERIRFMYEQNNSGYLEFLLDTTKFTDLLKRIEYINAIIDYDTTLFERYENTEALIAQKVEEIEIQKENVEVLVQAQEDKEAQLLASIEEKEKIIAELTSQESIYEQQIADLEQEDKEITALILAQTNTNSSVTYSGQLEYPVPAYRGYNYNSPYGPRINPISNKSEFHTGVDLKATLGTDIVAAESGTVIYSGVKGGYGKTVIIDHGNNMTTLYGHNSSLVVNVGDTVTRGQVIAKAGSTGYSTGVHLHFEVRINGSHVDPAPYIGH